MPNAAGLVPAVSDELLRSCLSSAFDNRKPGKEKGGKDKGKDKGDKSAKGDPSVVSVSVSADNHANIRSALQRSASETQLADAAAAAPARSSRQVPRPLGGLHKSASSPVVAAPRNAYVPPGRRAGIPAPMGADAPPPALEVFRREESVRRPEPGSRRRSEPLPTQPPLPPPCRTEALPEAMQRQRASLPAAAYASDICAAVARNQCVIVQGSTGCGKTTQVPQFILDEASASGTRCSIICTQPRRISAIGVSERVAEERGERLGGVVGYNIRLESATSSATRLLFCTTGILLRRLQDDPQLAGISHVLIDEVHERSMESDFLIMVLRSLLRSRANLRLVLMSATVEAGMFAAYFGAGTPVITIPGRTFPVTALFLEDALEVTGHRVRPNADWARKKGGGGRGGFNPAAPLPPDAPGRMYGARPADVAADAPDEQLSEAELVQRYPRVSASAVRALAALDTSQVNLELLAELVAFIMRCGTVAGVQRAFGIGLGQADAAWDAPAPERKAPTDKWRREADGESSSGDAAASNADSILIFLPGLKEITAALEQLTASGPLACEPQRSWVLPLHGSLTSEEQRRIFLKPPPGVRKVVLATNIAETSITIDDCGFVVDCGRMKETRYDPARRMESLEDVAVSKANAMQRRGRAGRVKSGVAFHLVSSHTFDKCLDAAQAPEMHRVPLEQLVLRIKVMGFPGRTAAQVVRDVLEPPQPAAVERAVSELVRLEALTVTAAGEQLTPLGSHLASLPVDVRIGKLILLGSIFGVVDDVLTIAATLSYRAPFLSPFERRAEADASKRAFSMGQSDHLTALNAYRAFDRGGGGKYDMCRERFLGVKTLQQIAGIKRQLLELLSDARFVRGGLRARSVEAMGRRADGSDGVRLALQEGAPGGGGGDACFNCGQRGHTARDCSAPRSRVLLSAADAWEQDSVDVPLIKALLTAALYPQIMTATRAGKKGGIKCQIREESGEVVEVAIHPSSVNAKESYFDSQYLVFHEKIKTTRIFVRDCSTISPYALILFGGALGSERAQAAGKKQRGGGGEELLTVDGWIKFSLPSTAVQLLLDVRSELDAVLRRKLEYPNADVSAAGKHILDAVVTLISTQG